MSVANYIWDVEADNYLMEVDDSHTVDVAYTAEPTLFGDILSQRRAGSTSYYHCDALGSMRAMTDAMGDVTKAASYIAYGEPLLWTGPVATNFGFAGTLGYYLDPLEGMIYVRERSYEPTIGRWMSADPLGIIDYIPSSLNRYLYVHNDPISGLDPSGAAGLSLLALFIWTTCAATCCGCGVNVYRSNRLRKQPETALAYVLCGGCAVCALAACVSFMGGVGCFVFIVGTTVLVVVAM